MAAKTSTFSCGTTATAVTTTIATNRVTIGEDPSAAGYPNAAFGIYAPTSGDTVIKKVAAANANAPQVTFTFFCDRAFWPAGTIVGYVKTYNGSAVLFQMYEDGIVY